MKKNLQFQSYKQYYEVNARK